MPRDELNLAERDVDVDEPDDELDPGNLEREDYDWLVFLLDTTDDDETIVARDGDKLAELTGIDDPQRLLAWVERWRPQLIARAAYELNECEASMGGDGLWVIYRGKVVNEGGFVHRELVKQERRERALAERRALLALILRPRLIRFRGRARRGRRATSRRTSARSPGRPADDDDLAPLEAVA
jgi:hypothetical protein